MDTNTHHKHCGACDSACQPWERCSQGRCLATCPSRTPTLCFGGCFNTQSHPSHCGACGNICPQGKTCQSGTCIEVCREGEVRCGSSCVFLESSAEHCGACGNACTGKKKCVEGQCLLLCDKPKVACGISCIDVQNDPKHCGQCNAICRSSRCWQGQCVIHAQLIRSATRQNCFLQNGNAQCWGWNTSGALGYGDTKTRLQPEGLFVPTRQQKIRDLVTNQSNTFAVMQDGTLKSWGANESGQLGYGDRKIRTQPTAEHINLFGQRIQRFHSQFGSHCAVLQDDKLYCWGTNNYGQLGYGDSRTRRT
ncbi:MAG: hypothetical protein AAGJ35_13335, partial [Myxococcota bacterium]